MDGKTDPTIANANHYHLQIEVFKMYLSKAKRKKIARLINNIECLYIEDHYQTVEVKDFNDRLGDLTLMLLAEGIPMLCADDYLEREANK